MARGYLGVVSVETIKMRSAGLAILGAAVFLLGHDVERPPMVIEPP